MSALEAGTIALAEVAGGASASAAEAGAAVEFLRTAARSWERLALRNRIEVLTATMATTQATAGRWVEAECRRKGIDPNADVAGEEWFLGPAFVLRNLRLLRRTLEALERAGQPLLGRVGAGPGGRVLVRAFPSDTYDRLLWPGYTGDVWLAPTVDAGDLARHVAVFYRGEAATAGQVCLVLGAGNVSSIAPNDALAKLFIEGQVVLLKLNPVTSPLAEVYRDALRPLVEGGWLRIVVGGAELGTFLARHPGIDTIHLTGSDKTFEAVVYGAGSEGRANKAAGRTLVAKPLTAELGSVSPVVVVPGRWTDRQLRYQGRQLASTALFNAGLNCISTRVLVTARPWNQRSALLDEVRAVLQTYPTRPAFYPGTVDRLDQVLAGHPEAERYGADGEAVVPWVLVPGVDPGEGDHPMLRVDPFAPIMAEVALEASTTAEFVDRALELCNDRIWGTLGITLLVHPSSLREPSIRAAVDRAVTNLRYGSIGVNTWAALGYSAVSTPWGAFPGHTPADIQSGTGFVHNTFMIDQPEKTVLRGPFTAWPQPVWFVTFGRRRQVFARNARLEAGPSARQLPGLVWHAVRG